MSIVLYELEWEMEWKSAEEILIGTTDIKSDSLIRKHNMSELFWLLSSSNIRNYTSIQFCLQCKSFLQFIQPRLRGGGINWNECEPRKRSFEC